LPSFLHRPAARKEKKNGGGGPREKGQEDYSIPLTSKREKRKGGEKGKGGVFSLDRPKENMKARDGVFPLLDPQNGEEKKGEKKKGVKESRNSSFSPTPRRRGKGKGKGNYCVNSSSLPSCSLMKGLGGENEREKGEGRNVDSSRSVEGKKK